MPTGYTPMAGQPQFPGHRPMPPAMPVIGPNGDPIFYHPHYPQLKADICKSCRHVVPIRPLRFAKKLTAAQIEEFKECFQVTNIPIQPKLSKIVKHSHKKYRK